MMLGPVWVKKRPPQTGPSRCFQPRRKRPWIHSLRWVTSPVGLSAFQWGAPQRGGGRPCLQLRPAGLDPVRLPRHQLLLRRPAQPSRRFAPLHPPDGHGARLAHLGGGIVPVWHGSQQNSGVKTLPKFSHRGLFFLKKFTHLSIMLNKLLRILEAIPILRFDFSGFFHLIHHHSYVPRKL